MLTDTSTNRSLAALPIPAKDPKPCPKSFDNVSFVRPSPSASRTEAQNAQQTNQVPVLPPNTLKDPPKLSPSRKRLSDLPSEIQEKILGHLIGHLGTTSSASVDLYGTRNWSTAMRHPHRDLMFNLALVSRAWQCMVQQRLYRHIKVMGTKEGLNKCADWFLTNIHLQEHVRHLEVLVPVWEMKPGRHSTQAASASRTNEPREPPVVFSWIRDSSGGNLTSNNLVFNNDNAAYRLAHDTAALQNATLDEIFGYAKCLFPFACALTIEGGSCMKPPKIQQFRGMPAALDTSTNRWGTEIIVVPHFKGLQSDKSMQHIDSLFGCSQPGEQIATHQRLPDLPNIRTLVLKGAWNIIRNHFDFKLLTTSLPNLREWHCAYAKPKTKGYIAICAILEHFPPTIAHVNICLEGLSGDGCSLKKWRKLYPKHHICVDFGRIAPQLETLTYTGRICSCLFNTASEAVIKSRDASRLKSVDIIVRNCCRRDPKADSDGTGAYNRSFIQAFEVLVRASVHSLRSFPHLNSLRIRFLDLDSLSPLLNPYFELQDTSCQGLWSDEILQALAETRPNAKFPEAKTDLLIHGGKAGGRPKSMKASDYAGLMSAGDLWY